MTDRDVFFHAHIVTMSFIMTIIGYNESPLDIAKKKQPRLAAAFFMLFCAQMNRSRHLFGERALEPYAADIDGVIEALFFGLFDNTITRPQVFIRGYELNQYLSRGVSILYSGRAHYLEHHDIFIIHVAIIDDVSTAYQGLALICQKRFFFSFFLCHSSSP
jgi:hypothetical protein